MGRSGCKGRGYRAGDSAGVAALKRSMRGELRDTDETDDGRMYRSAGSWSSWAEATDRYCDTSSAWSPDGARPVAPRFLDHRRPLLVTSGQRLPSGHRNCSAPGHPDRARPVASRFLDHRRPLLRTSQLLDHRRPLPVALTEPAPVASRLLDQRRPRLISQTKPALLTSQLLGNWAAPDQPDQARPGDVAIARHWRPRLVTQTEPALLTSRLLGSWRPSRLPRTSAPW